MAVYAYAPGGVLVAASAGDKGLAADFIAAALEGASGVDPGHLVDASELVGRETGADAVKGARRKGRKGRRGRRDRKGRKGPEEYCGSGSGKTMM